MTRKSYFVDPAPLRSNLLRMEIEIAHVLINDIRHAVLNEDYLRDYVEQLKSAQDNIARNNPKLRRVEIHHDLDRHGGYGIEYMHFITIGQWNCPLREVTKIF